jgi:hypothetical protein
VLTPITIILLAVAKGAGEGFAEVVKDRIHKSFIIKSGAEEGEKRIKAMEKLPEKNECLDKLEERLKEAGRTCSRGGSHSSYDSKADR